MTNKSFSQRLIDSKEGRVAIRLAVVALEFFLYREVDISLMQTALLGVTISVPSTIIAGGLSLIYLSTQCAFNELGFMFCYLAGGYFLLENYHIVDWGILERFIDVSEPVTEFVATPNKEWLFPNHYFPTRSQEERLLEFKEIHRETRASYEEEQKSAPERGVFSYRDLHRLFGTENIIEFFYAANEIEGNEAIKQLALSMTGGGMQQIHYASFSNTFLRSFHIDGKVWKSREHYILAQLFHEGSTTYRAIHQGAGDLSKPKALAETLKDAKYQNDLRVNSVETRMRWNQVELYQFALNANMAYFSQHQSERRLLLSTQNLPLVERPHIPNRWGIAEKASSKDLLSPEKERINRNMQGWILMKIRDHLRFEQALNINAV